MIPGDILIAVVVVLAGAIAWLALRALGTLIVRCRQVQAQRNREPRTQGDDGGHPIPVRRGHVTRLPR